jgi:hypothetical protein
MLALPLDPAFYPLLILHCCIGALSSVVAKQKGYNFGLWLVLGFIGGTATLMFALFVKEKEVR